MPYLVQPVHPIQAVDFHRGILGLRVRDVKAAGRDVCFLAATREEMSNACEGEQVPCCYLALPVFLASCWNIGQAELAGGLTPNTHQAWKPSPT